MTRTQAYELLTKYLKNQNLIKHCLAAEASMKAIYRKLHEGKSSYAKATEDTWGIVGLLHDLDYELAQSTNQLNKHGLLIFEKEPNTIPVDIARAIKAHNWENTKVSPQTDMEWAIACADQLTGLIVAAALVHPDRKLVSLTREFILNRMKEKSFARGAKREPILLCEEKLGIPLAEFVTITLTAMQGINNDLGL